MVVSNRNLLFQGVYFQGRTVKFQGGYPSPKTDTSLEEISAETVFERKLNRLQATCLKGDVFVFFFDGVLL